jgi:hypothetical protein
MVYQSIKIYWPLKMDLIIIKMLVKKKLLNLSIKKIKEKILNKDLKKE